MKIALAQIQSYKGDISNNIKKHLHYIELAIAQHVELILFPELSITGYEPTLAHQLATTAFDPRFEVFQKRSNLHQIIIGIGVPIQRDTGICISLVLFHPDSAPQVYSKKYLHEDECPFFVKGKNNEILIRNTNISLAICYEFFQAEHVKEGIASGGQIYLASVAKSENGIRKAQTRVMDITTTFEIPILMANAIGPADDFIAAGQSTIWNKEGQIIAKLNGTEEGLLVHQLP